MSVEFWDKRAQKYDETERKHGPTYEKMLADIRSQLQPSDVVLDFACASGELTLDLAPGVRRIQGIDTSVQMITLAQEKIPFRHVDNVRFDAIDVFDESLAEQSFSAIFAYYILHLLEDLPQVISRLQRLLLPGGLLISQTPCLKSASWGVRSFVALAKTLRLVPPIILLTAENLECLLTDNGFHIQKSILWDNSKAAIQWIVAEKR